jgi:hypothetical protein
MAPPCEQTHTYLHLQQTTHHYSSPVSWRWGSVLFSLAVLRLSPRASHMLCTLPPQLEATVFKRHGSSQCHPDPVSNSGRRLNMICPRHTRWSEGKCWFFWQELPGSLPEAGHYRTSKWGSENHRAARTWAPATHNSFGDSHLLYNQECMASPRATWPHASGKGAGLGIEGVGGRGRGRSGW